MRAVSSILAVVSSLSLVSAAPVANPFVEAPAVHDFVPEYDLTLYDPHTAYPKGAQCGALACDDVTREILTKKKHGSKYCGHSLLCAKVDVSLLGKGDKGGHHHGNNKHCGAILCADVDAAVLSKKKCGVKHCKGNVLCADVDITLLGINLAEVDVDVSLLGGHDSHCAPHHGGSHNNGPHNGDSHNNGPHNGGSHNNDPHNDGSHHDTPHHGTPHHGNKKYCGAILCADVDAAVLSKKKCGVKYCKGNVLCANIDITLLGINLAEVNVDVSLLDGHDHHCDPHHGGPHRAPHHGGHHGGLVDLDLGVDVL